MRCDCERLDGAHIFEQFAGPLLDIYRGDVTVAFARGIETVAADFGFVKPHFCRTAPRLLEKIHAAVWSKSEVLAELTRHPLVRQLVHEIVTEKNRSLARYETIKDFILLERDLSIEAGDLTPTLKLKKKQLVDRYGRQLDELYR